jgi:hypothetical protein
MVFDHTNDSYVGIEQLQNTIQPLTTKRTRVTTEEDITGTGKRKKTEETEEISSSPPETICSTAILQSILHPTDSAFEMTGLKFSFKKDGDVNVEIGSFKKFK